MVRAEVETQVDCIRKAGIEALRKSIKLLEDVLQPELLSSEVGSGLLERRACAVMLGARRLAEAVKTTDTVLKELKNMEER